MILEQFSRLIEERTGLSARTRAETDLENLLTQLSGGDLVSFYQTLRLGKLFDPAWQTVIQALTIGETYFFRDEASFKLLRSSLLPEFIRRRRQEHRYELRIWCAGCATGEEPYSLAMTLLDILPDLPDWSIMLIGTDINAQALAQAREGSYRDWAFRQPAADYQSRFFVREPGGWRIKPVLRDMVTFQQASLLHTPPMTQCDLILCRNVLIYLSREQIGALEDRFYKALNPGGWLLLGSSEAIRSQRERWITQVLPDLVYYQKPVDARWQPIIRHNRPIPHVIDQSDTLLMPSLAYQTALASVRAKQLDEAEILLDRLLMEQPDFIPARILLVYILASRQAAAEAHAQLDTVLNQDSLQSDAHYLRATLYLEAGQPEEAEKSLRAALYCQRDHPLATVMLGNLYASTGRNRLAVRFWQSARDLLRDLPSDAPVTDLTDMTAGTLGTLIQSQLESLHASRIEAQPGRQGIQRPQQVLRTRRH